MLGGARGRRHAFRPASVVNISGMSFGALSGTAIEALNRGAAMAGCLQNTGEGGLSPYHRNGGDLVFQIGTGYFGCRDEHGNFDLARLKDLVASAPVRAIEIKLSQGAKPGLGGMLPGAKVTPEIAEIRGIPVGKDCASPSRHQVFRDVDSMLDFVETVADGDRAAGRHQVRGRQPGLLGRAGRTWRTALAGRPRRRLRQHRRRRGRHRRRAAGLRRLGRLPVPDRASPRSTAGSPRPASTDDVAFIGAGKLGLPGERRRRLRARRRRGQRGREAMLAIGCIQAQKCHTDHCPTGVATQNPRCTRGLDPTSSRCACANYVRALRRDLLKVSEAVGVVHPGLIGPDDVDVVDGLRTHRADARGLRLRARWGVVGPELREEISRAHGADRVTEHPPAADLRADRLRRRRAA